MQRLSNAWWTECSFSCQRSHVESVTQIRLGSTRPVDSTGSQPDTELKYIEGSNVIVSNIEIIPGKQVTKHLGMVQGNTVRTKHLGRDIMAGLKNIVGGELVGYTELLNDARQEATDRMIGQAKSIGANAVLNVRFSTSSVSAGAAELFVYGTAVVVE